MNKELLCFASSIIEGPSYHELFTYGILKISCSSASLSTNYQQITRKEEVDCQYASKILTNISSDQPCQFNHNKQDQKRYLGIVHLLMPGFDNTPPRVGHSLVETGDVVVVDALVEGFVDQSGIGRFVMVVVVVIVAVAV